VLSDQEIGPRSSPGHTGKPAATGWRSRALADQRDHPLTARVMVNRVWRSTSDGRVRDAGNWELGAAPRPDSWIGWPVDFMQQGWTLSGLPGKS
jgi:hypothetical protein